VDQKRLIIKLWWGDPYAREKAQRWANKTDLLVHVLNALMTAWNLSHHLAKHLQLSEAAFLLGLTLHDYNKYIQGQGEEAQPRKLMRYQQF